MSKFLEFLADLLQRLTSRKFVLTFAGIWAVVQFPDQAAAICTLIATFTGAEGAADVVQRYAASKATSTESAVTAALSTIADNGEDEFVTGADPVPGKDTTTTSGEAPL